MDTMLCQPDSHCSEGLVPAAESAVGRKPSAVSPFRDCLGSSELCHAVSHVGPHPIMEGYLGLAILARLGTNLKGHSNSRTSCGVSQVCHWTCISTSFVIKIMPLTSSIFKVQLLLTKFLSLARGMWVLYAARSCWCSIIFSLILG